MEYKTLKKELNKLAKANNVCLTFGEKKQFDRGCFLISNYGFVEGSSGTVEVESEIPSNANWTSRDKGYWMHDENGKATEYRDVIHWDYREYTIVDVEKIFNRYGTMVLESADCYNNSKYGKHDLLKTYRVYLSDKYLK